MTNVSSALYKENPEGVCDQVNTTLNFRRNKMAATLLKFLDGNNLFVSS